MFDLQGYHHPLLDQRDLVAAGDATDYVEFGPVPTSHVWMLTSVTSLNDTRAAGIPILSLVRGGREFPLDSGGVMTRYLPQSFAGWSYAGEGCLVRVYIMTLTANDIVHVVIAGLDLVREIPGPAPAGA
jgi:hypothetical protein